MTFEEAKEKYKDEKVSLICELADPIQGPLAEFWCHDCNKAICEYCAFLSKNSDGIIVHKKHYIVKL